MCKVWAQQLGPSAVSQSSPVVFMLSRQRGEPWIIPCDNRRGARTKRRGRGKGGEKERGVDRDGSSSRAVIGAQRSRTILPKGGGKRRRKEEEEEGSP